MTKQLYKELTINGDCNLKLSYYLLIDSIREEYCDLKVYGAEIHKSYIIDSGEEMFETKTIKNLFFRKNEAEIFLDKLARNQVTPMGLKSAVSEHICEQLKLLSCEG